MNVRSSMTPNPQTIGPTDMLAVAEEKMRRGRFRRLPVVDATGALVGIVTDGDLRQHHGRLPSTPVSTAMGTPAIMVNPDAAIDTAASIMLERKIGALPVVGDDGRLVGIITETDLLRAFLRLLRDQRSGA
jgi:acetoin utilization protein AcuB